jgi:MFS family permease
MAAWRMAGYTSGAILVRLADEGARVGLVLLALERTGSAALGGLLVAALLVPHVLAAPLLGALADTVRRPVALVGACAGAFGLALAAAALGLGRLPLALVVVVLLAGGSCGPAITGALSSQVPALVTPAALPRAFGVDALTYDVAGMLGPAVAAVVAGRASASTATFTLGAAAVVGGAVAAALPVRRPSAVRPPATSARPAGALRPATSLLAGLRVLARDRVLAVVTAATSIAQLGAGALPVVVAVIATRAGSPAQAGLLLTVLTAGSLVGSLLWTWRPAGPDHAPRTVFAGLVGTGLPLAVAAFAPSIAWTGVLFAVSGVANGPLFGALLMTRQRFAPEHARSQVFTLGAGLKITAAAAGSALAGLAAGLPSATQLLLLAACSVLAGVGGAVILRHVRSPVGPRGPATPDAGTPVIRRWAG